MSDVKAVPLRDSKLFELAAGIRLFDHLSPDLPQQMQMEAYLSEQAPREVGNEATRIFLVYVNSRGSTMMIKIEDPARLNMRADIDGFLEAVSQENTSADLPIDYVERLTFLLTHVLTHSVGAILELDTYTTFSKTTGQSLLANIVACVAQDPLDQVLFLEELPKADDPDETSLVITSMWTVKSRNG